MTFIKTFSRSKAALFASFLSACSYMQETVEHKGALNPDGRPSPSALGEEELSRKKLKKKKGNLPEHDPDQNKKPKFTGSPDSIPI